MIMQILWLIKHPFLPPVIIMFVKKDGGINVVTNKRTAIGAFFDKPCKSTDQSFVNSYRL